MTRIRRGDLAVALALAAVVLGVFWRWLAAPGHTLYSPWSDVIVQFSGWKAFMARAAAEGHGIAFWNPTYYCGTPAYANPQYLWAHPLHVLFHVLPVDQAIAPTFALYLLLIGLGTHLWLRLCGLDVLSAGVGAVAGVLAPRLLYHIAGGFLPYLLGVACLPWVFAAAEYACRRPSAWRWGLTALALALLVSSGFVQLWLYAGYALAVYVALRPTEGWVPSPAATPQLPEPKRPLLPRAVQRLFGLAGAYAASLLLAAYHFWPAYVFAQYTTRGGTLPLERVTDISIVGWHWLTALLPQPWGDPSRMLAAGDGLWLMWEQNLAFGIVPLLLVFAGRRSPHRRLWTALALLLAVCLAFAWGAGNPAFPLLYRLPGIARFRFPVRFLFVAGVVLSGLTATGVAALLHGPRPRTPRPTGWGFAVVAPIVVGLWLFVRARVLDARMLATAPAALWWVVGIALTLAIVCVVARRTRDARWVAAAVAALLVIDAGRSAGWVVRMEDPDVVYPINAPIAALQDRGGVQRVMDFSGAVHKGMPGRAGLQIPDGYDPLQLAHMVRFMRALTHDPDQGGGNDIHIGDVREPHLYALLGAAVTVERARDAGTDRAPIAQFERVPTFQFWQGVGRIPERVQVTVDAGALPRAFVVGPARRVAVEDEEDALRAFAPTREVLLATEPPVQGTARFAAADITAYAPNSVTVRATSDGPGYLVLTDAWYPAWAATRNGEPAPLLRADGMFRAVPLPAAGEWTVEMRYLPTAEARGAWVTGVGLLGLVALGVRARARA